MLDGISLEEMVFVDVAKSTDEQIIPQRAPEERAEPDQPELGNGRRYPRPSPRDHD